VVDGANTIIGFLDEREVARVYLEAAARAQHRLEPAIRTRPGRRRKR
jgi:hypothetical protein